MATTGVRRDATPDHDSNAVGWDHAHLGDHRQALEFCRRALALHQQVDNRSGAAATWDSLGYAYHRLGDHTRAVGCYRCALELFEAVGNRHQQALTLGNLADAQLAAGDTGAAGAACRRALAILEPLDHRDAGPIREKLARLRSASALPHCDQAS